MQANLKKSKDRAMLAMSARYSREVFDYLGVDIMENPKKLANPKFTYCTNYGYRIGVSDRSPGEMLTHVEFWFDCKSGQPINWGLKRTEDGYGWDCAIASREDLDAWFDRLDEHKKELFLSFDE